MLEACDEVGDLLQLKFSSGVAGGALPEELELAEKNAKMVSAEGKELTPPRWRVQDVLRRGVEDVQMPLR
jgi:serine palmitoyltransferase